MTDEQKVRIILDITPRTKGLIDRLVQDMNFTVRNEFFEEFFKGKDSFLTEAMGFMKKEARNFQPRDAE